MSYPAMLQACAFCHFTEWCS